EDFARDDRRRAADAAADHERRLVPDVEMRSALDRLPRRRPIVIAKDLGVADRADAAALGLALDDRTDLRLLRPGERHAAVQTDERHEARRTRRDAREAQHPAHHAP